MERQRLLELDYSSLSEKVIDVLLFDPATDTSVFDEIAKENIHRPEILRMLLEHPLTPHKTRQFVAEKLHVPAPIGKDIKPVLEDGEAVKRKTIGLLQKIQKLRIGEKIQLAFRGSRDVRTILLRDPNKEVMLAVLENPKITYGEVEVLAKQQTTPVEIIRSIDKNKEWVRVYRIVHALISNPKTPPSISLKHIHKLRTKDLASLEKNRNIPEAVRVSAKKLINERKR